jgi:hypothetical protein
MYLKYPFPPYSFASSYLPLKSLPSPWTYSQTSPSSSVPATTLARAFLRGALFFVLIAGYLSALDPSPVFSDHLVIAAGQQIH